MENRLPGQLISTFELAPRKRSLPEDRNGGISSSTLGLLVVTFLNGAKHLGVTLNWSISSSEQEKSVVWD